MDPLIIFYRRSKMDSYHFDLWQEREINLGWEHGLTEDQIGIYAKSYYDSWQMYEIRNAIEEKLGGEVILLLTSADFCALKMHQIRLGFENGLSIEQVAIYAKEKYSYFEMSEIRSGLEYGIKVPLIFNTLHTYGVSNLLDFALKKSVPVIYFAYWVKRCSKMGFSAEEMKEVFWGVLHHLEEDEILLYAKPIYYADQMKEIRLGLEDKMSNEEIEKFSDFHMEPREMRRIRLTLARFHQQEDDDE